VEATCAVEPGDQLAVRLWTAAEPPALAVEALASGEPCRIDGLPAGRYRARLEPLLLRGGASLHEDEVEV
jgi:hypothetical protein